MVVALGTWELHLPGCHSLKEKRGVLRPLTNRLRTKLNVSVAETAHQDSWQRAEIACAAVASDRGSLERTLSTVDRYIETANGIRIIDTVTMYQ